jgi:hypothetical protein
LPISAHPVPVGPLARVPVSRSASIPGESTGEPMLCGIAAYRPVRIAGRYSGLRVRIGIGIEIEIKVQNKFNPDRNEIHASTKFMNLEPGTLNYFGFSPTNNTVIPMVNFR